MGKKKFDQNALYELAEQAKGIKMKKKAVQFACCHKDKKGNFRLKPVKDSKNQYLFKCKICKDRKVDLSILNQKEGTIKEQLKAAAAKRNCGPIRNWLSKLCVPIRKAKASITNAKLM